jgi:hypothetical protein
MADSPTSPAEGSDPRLSWRDRELLTALRRLANSRAQVAGLEATTAARAQVPVPDPADVRRMHDLEDELVRLRAKATARFGGGAARDRIPEVEMQQRLVLERLGYDTLAELDRAVEEAADAPDPVDPAIVDFARRELAAAEEAYEQLLAMPDDEDDALPPGRVRSTESSTIDLTKPSGR